ncbi:MAG: hypothetical protein AB7T31_04095 [Gemmatimonadales bacterium]
MRTTYGRVWMSFGLVAALAAPAHTRAQASPDPERAATLEAEAARLQETPSRQADAASLLLAAAGLRRREDAQARRDLFLAANLTYQLGDRAGAVAALDSAGSRALSAGDSVFATEMFANAASIAQEAGLVDQERRYRSRVAELGVAAARRRGSS